MQTQRLAIRRFAPQDGPALYEYLSDPEVVRYEPYPPQTLAVCEEWAAHHAQSADFWAVCLGEDGRLIGNVYLAAKEQDGWEVGYVFNRRYWGSGYAAEAVKALVDDVFRNQNGHRVYANCNPQNTASWRLLERLGFRREGHLRGNVYFSRDEAGTPLWQDTYEYGLLREEWPL